MLGSKNEPQPTITYLRDLCLCENPILSHGGTEDTKVQSCKVGIRKAAHHSYAVVQKMPRYIRSKMPGGFYEIRGLFSRRYVKAGDADGTRNQSRLRTREAAIWQRRYWEHSAWVATGTAVDVRNWSLTGRMRWVNRLGYD